MQNNIKDNYFDAVLKVKDINKAKEVENPIMVYGRRPVVFI